MTRWYPLAPADADFLVSAPHVFRYEKRFAAAPEQVWESMVSDDSLAAWGPSVKSVTWTSPRPFGVGTTREAVPAGGATLRERYFRWDEGHQNSFYVYESTLPLFKRFAEDYIVEADGGHTRFTWVVAIEPKKAMSLPVKVLSPLLKAGLERIPRDGQKYFAATA
ncbi:polyketide cyclase [Mycolicibacterium celeriflavum]|uniref:SRPBCC family protein n=1 Tax=Mycolicibacterium celeriflavum TaxID=1249101 RepID=UPI0008014260|nr:SRPBCC family protein [Mycolicibacterium celeriflavum]OBG22477.1 polyketide cyclase [Mycolicibacterium celeriflavum]